MKPLTLITAVILLSACGSPEPPPARRPSPLITKDTAPKILAKDLPGLLREDRSGECKKLDSIIKHTVTWDTNPMWKEPPYHRASVEGVIRCRNHHTQLADQWEIHKPVEERFRVSWEETVKRTFYISVVADDNHFVTLQGPSISE